MWTPPSRIEAPPEELRSRLSSQILGIHSVWFPTRRELKQWSAASGPLYLRWSSADRFEVGPRLGSMWASCFSPVLAGEITESDGATEISWVRRFPRFTTALLGGWAVVLLIWAATMLPPLLDGTVPSGLPWWLLLAASAVAAPAVGGSMGGQALDDAAPQLITLLGDADVPDEDW